jgi:tetratricopeptide (TPR) repeat protein
MKFKIPTRLLVIAFSGFLAGVHGEQGVATVGPASQAQAPPPASAPDQARQDSGKRPSLTLEDRADIFMARKSYADAADYYTRCLKQPNCASAPVWNKLGIAYQQELNYRAARKAYNKAVRLQKSYAEPLNNMGTTYFFEKRYKKSVQYYQRAVELNPSSPSFHVNLGTSYFHLKRYQEFVQEYRTALGLDPDVLTERTAVGTIMEARGAEPEYYFYLARVFASLGRVEDAVRYLRRAMEEGFKDQKKIDEAPELAKISQEPPFIELMKNRPTPIKE